MSVESVDSRPNKVVNRLRTSGNIVLATGFGVNIVAGFGNRLDVAVGAGVAMGVGAGLNLIAGKIEAHNKH